jgi:hypothetical protein
MSNLEGNRYIPYLATAEAIVETDNSPELFLRSLVPSATDEQIASFCLYTIGKFHDGIIQGLEIAGCDPIGEVEAFQTGVQEGFDFRIE